MKTYIGTNCYKIETKFTICESENRNNCKDDNHIMHERYHHSLIDSLLAGELKSFEHFFYKFPEVISFLIYINGELRVHYFNPKIDMK